MRRRAHKGHQKLEEAHPSKEKEPNKETNTEREEENKGNRSGAMNTGEKFRKHKEKSGRDGKIKRSLEQRCKEEEEGDQGP